MAELAARESRIAVRRARVAARLLAANSAKKDRECSLARLVFLLVDSYIGLQFFYSHFLSVV